jgi:hypothetical protein
MVSIYIILALLSTTAYAQDPVPYGDLPDFGNIFLAPETDQSIPVQDPTMETTNTETMETTETELIDTTETGYSNAPTTTDDSSDPSSIFLSGQESTRPMYMLVAFLFF